MRPIPAVHLMAIGQVNVEDFGAFGRLSPPALGLFRRKNPLPLPLIQLGIASRAGDGNHAGG